jgi:hypothetical protein
MITNQRKKVLAWLLDHPGSTPSELSQGSGCSSQMSAKHLRWAEGAGLAARTGSRLPPSGRGRPSDEWSLTRGGEQAAGREGFDVDAWRAARAAADEERALEKHHQVVTGPMDERIRRLEEEHSLWQAKTGRSIDRAQRAYERLLARSVEEPGRTVIYPESELLETEDGYYHLRGPESERGPEPAPPAPGPKPALADDSGAPSLHCQSSTPSSQSWGEWGPEPAVIHEVQASDRESGEGQKKGRLTPSLVEE